MAKLGFFNLTIYLDSPRALTVQAGKSDAEAESAQCYTIIAPKRSEIVQQLLSKLITALQQKAESIDVKTDGKEIVKDEAYSLLPHVEAMLDAADDLKPQVEAIAEATDGLQSALQQFQKALRKHKPPSGKK